MTEGIWLPQPHQVDFSTGMISAWLPPPNTKLGQREEKKRAVEKRQAALRLWKQLTANWTSLLHTHGDDWLMNEWDILC